MLTPDEKKRILEIHDSEEYPLGNFYFLKALNPISIIPYFYWWVIPFFSLVILFICKLMKNELILGLTSFGRNLKGFVDLDIILLHEIYAILSLILPVLIILSKNIVNDNFIIDMRKLNKWYRQISSPLSDNQFIKKTILASITYLFVVQFVFWGLYPSPFHSGIRLFIAQHFLLHFLFLNFFLFSYILVLSSLFTIYGVKKYGM